MIYAQNEAGFLELDQELLSKDGYPLGTTLDDYWIGCWILLNEEQIEFHNSNPTATPAEVIVMKLDTDKRLKDAKSSKISDLIEYDKSTEVNSFFLNSSPVWVEEERRSGMKNSIDSAELLGESNITFNITGIELTTTVINAKVMLAKLQRYADNCYLVTENHKAAIKKLESVDEVLKYNFKVGYPEKVSFTV